MSRISRNAEIPIVLWICAAICAHFLFGGGTEEVSKELRKFSDDTQFISALGAKTRQRVRSTEVSLEVSVVDQGVPPAPPEEPPQAAAKVLVPKPKEAPKKPDPKKPDEVAKPKAETKTPEKDQNPAKKPSEPEPKPDRRVAVKQHAKPNQADNPNARFIADEANKVEDEQVATQTAHDDDAENPSPGANKTAGPKDHTGDSERTKIADSDEHAGNKERAPGEKGATFEAQKDNRPIEKPQAASPVPAPALQTPPNQPRTGGDGRTASQVSPVPPALAPGEKPASAQEIAESPAGAAWFSPIRPGAVAGEPERNLPVAGTTNQARAANPNAPKSTQWLGLGGNPGPGQVNLNLSNNGVVAVVGVDQLRKEREADGERRKSEHRGSWTASNFERWRNAIENYVSSVKPGNQTALNAAAVPFATYLNTIHNRIHPIFADSFLGSLGGLPKTHPLNSPQLITRVEIVVSPREGRVVKIGIVKASGMTAFDVAAMDSVSRAQPFGPAPSAIVSPDGNVYLHWEFHRDEVFACSTVNARPFLLAAPPSKALPTEPPRPPAPAPKDPREQGGPLPVNAREMREG